MNSSTDSNKTISEILFEDFCQRQSIKFQRISTDVNRTPDYNVRLCGEEVIVEVKQIDMNPNDKKQYEILRQGGIAQGGGTPGARARKKVSDANRQLARLTRKKLPSILVLYNNTPLGYHTDPYNIRAAMYGLETFVFAKPVDKRISPYIADRKFGPKRKMTKTMNTSTSAVAAM